MNSDLFISYKSHQLQSYLPHDYSNMRNILIMAAAFVDEIPYNIASQSNGKNRITYRDGLQKVPYKSLFSDLTLNKKNIIQKKIHGSNKWVDTDIIAINPEVLY